MWRVLDLIRVYVARDGTASDRIRTKGTKSGAADARPDKPLVS